MDDKYVYVFIRQDLSVPQQLVHASHAVYHMVQKYTYLTEVHVPSVIVIGVPDLKSLNKVGVKLRDNGIEAYHWEEPDEVDSSLKGTLAIVTVPMDGKEKEILRNYRLYNVVNNSLGAEQSACSVKADKGAKCRCKHPANCPLSSTTRALGI